MPRYRERPGNQNRGRSEPRVMCRVSIALSLSFLRGRATTASSASRHADLPSLLRRLRGARGAGGFGGRLCVWLSVWRSLSFSIEGDKIPKGASGFHQNRYCTQQPSIGFMILEAMQICDSENPNLSSESCPSPFRARAHQSAYPGSEFRAWLAPVSLLPGHHTPHL